MHNQKEIEVMYGITVEETFYNLVQAVVCHSAIELDRDRVYDADALLGNHFVCEKDAVDQYQAEACLEHLVEKQKVPLVLVKREPEGRVEYILK